MKEKTTLAKIVKEADAVVVIAQKGEDVSLTFSPNLTELEVLDMLSLVTSEFYLVASEDDGKIH